MSTIPFEVPAKFLSRYAAGAIRRIGTNLIDVNSGKIVGHLQEAGRWYKLAGGVNPFVQVGQLASSVYANVQLEQVKRMLSGLQMMTQATLAVSAVNLGVSVVGFAVVVRKLDQLSSQICMLENRLSEVHRLVSNIDIRQRARDRAAVFSLMASGDEAWKRRDQVAIWSNLANELLREEQYYRMLLATDVPREDAFILRPTASWLDVVAAHETLTYLVAARTQCLMLLNELDAAIHYANDWLSWLSRNYDPLTPPDIVKGRLNFAGRDTASSEDPLRLAKLEEMQSFLEIVRVQQQFAKTVPNTVRTLIHRGIDGRDYIERLRDEETEEILVLEAGAT